MSKRLIEVTDEITINPLTIGELKILVEQLFKEYSDDDTMSVVGCYGEYDVSYKRLETDKEYKERLGIEDRSRERRLAQYNLLKKEFGNE